MTQAIWTAIDQNATMPTEMRAALLVERWGAASLGINPCPFKLMRIEQLIWIYRAFMKFKTPDLWPKMSQAEWALIKEARDGQ